MIVQRSDYNISIVLFTNLGVGAGTENIAKILAEQLLKNDTSHRVRIVQTDYMGPYSANKRVDIQNENGLIIDEIKSPLNIKFIQRMLKGPPLWHKIGEIVKIVLYMILNFKKISSILKEDDCIIFLSYNEAWGWYPFKRQNNYFVISGDCGMPTVGLAKCILEKFADSLHFLTRAQEERFGSTQILTFNISRIRKNL